MIDFMVIGLPRSGTTWAANWLTTDTTLCLHDPLSFCKYDELDNIKSSKVLGISCTSILFYPDWLNKHKAKKVILHRGIDEINKSLAVIGLPRLSERFMLFLDSIEGMHVKWDDLFYHPKPIYEYLLTKPFDAERHKNLLQMNIQPEFQRIEVNGNAAQHLINKIKEVL